MPDANISCLILYYYLSHSGQALPRAAYAKLYSAGFQPVLDRIGEPAEVIDPNDITNYIAAKEDMDRLKANEIHIQFLAYARYDNI